MTEEPSHSLGNKVINDFLALCVWTRDTWQLPKHLFDLNPNRSQMGGPRLEGFFFNLSVILQEYWLLQVAKLHDPAVQQSGVNLSLDYVVRYGAWPTPVKLELEKLLKDMSNLSYLKAIRNARNKVLSHNDLETILNAAPVGGFENRDDDLYFEMLMQFYRIVATNSGKGPWEPNELVAQDVKAFISKFDERARQ